MTDCEKKKGLISEEKRVQSKLNAVEIEIAVNAVISYVVTGFIEHRLGSFTAR